MELMSPDSGDPFVFAPLAKAAYERLGIDYRDKTIIYSDALNVDKVMRLRKQCEDVGFLPSFGIGTFLTNDFKSKSSGFKEKSRALNIVVKLASVDGKPCIKISDDIKKVRVTSSETLGWNAVDVSLQWCARRVEYGGQGDGGEGEGPLSISLDRSKNPQFRKITNRALVALPKASLNSILAPYNQLRDYYRRRPQNGRQAVQALYRLVDAAALMAWLALYLANGGHGGLLSKANTFEPATLTSYSLSAMSGLNLNSWTENASRLGMRLQETFSEHTKDLAISRGGSATYLDTGEDKVKNIRKQLDSNSDREKLEAMKRLIA
ncbi:hypothetical protein EW146_g10390, partial [Bondarzewia mesenterica]